MAVSESYREYVMEQLETVGPVQSRKMFGGVGIYLGDLFFALIAQNTLFFKVDDTTRDDFIKADMKPFKPYKDKPMTMQYYEVPIDVLEDRSEMQIWANNAIDVALRARNGKK
jgi:DNA transformation protein and related proteins